MTATKPIRTVLMTLATLAALTACGAPSVEVAEDLSAWALDLEERTLRDLDGVRPELQAELDRAVGYAIFANRATKVPVFGRGEGLGVTVDRGDGSRHYLSVTHFDVGGGLGNLGYRLVILFFDRDDFERLRTGTLHVGASIDAGAGGDTAGFSGTSLGLSKNQRRAVYVLGDSGATATWTIRLVRFVPLDRD